MLAFLRQVARALTGKVDPLEFALGIFFGFLLGLVPASEVDFGTGWIGWNATWIVILFVLLSLRASIPVAIVFAAFGQLLGMAFLDQAAFSVGQSMLDGHGPDGLALSMFESMAAFQLHTFWGFGAVLVGGCFAALSGIISYFVFRKKLPVWRQRFSQSKFAKALSGFFVFRALRFLLR
ncbi:MAG: hypothetical protein H8E15_11145 [Planctomycetes bacterium]|nr:hypothetical protein [Planctomycetota bacterium]